MPLLPFFAARQSTASGWTWTFLALRSARGSAVDFTRNLLCGNTTTNYGTGSTCPSLWFQVSGGFGFDVAKPPET
jgi:hypothetical protein